MLVLKELFSSSVSSNPDYSQATGVSLHGVCNSGNGLNNQISVGQVLPKFYKISHYIYRYLLLVTPFNSKKNQPCLPKSEFSYVLMKIHRSRFYIKGSL